MLEGRGFTSGFNRTSGALESYVVDGHEGLSAPLEPDFWRAPNDNDLGAKLDQELEGDFGRCFMP